VGLVQSALSVDFNHVIGT